MIVPGRYFPCILLPELTHKAGQHPPDPADPLLFQTVYMIRRYMDIGSQVSRRPVLQKNPLQDLPFLLRQPFHRPGHPVRDRTAFRNFFRKRLGSRQYFRQSFTETSFPL